MHHIVNAETGEDMLWAIVNYLSLWDQKPLHIVHGLTLFKKFLTPYLVILQLGLWYFHNRYFGIFIKHNTWVLLNSIDIKTYLHTDGIKISKSSKSIAGLVSNCWDLVALIDMILNLCFNHPQLNNEYL